MRFQFPDFALLNIDEGDVRSPPTAKVAVTTVSATDINDLHSGFDRHAHGELSVSALHQPRLVRSLRPTLIALDFMSLELTIVLPL